MQQSELCLRETWPSVKRCTLWMPVCLMRSTDELSFLSTFADTVNNWSGVFVLPLDWVCCSCRRRRGLLFSLFSLPLQSVDDASSLSYAASVRKKRLTNIKWSLNTICFCGWALSVMAFTIVVTVLMWWPPAVCARVLAMQCAARTVPHPVKRRAYFYCVDHQGCHSEIVLRRMDCLLWVCDY